MINKHSDFAKYRNGTYDVYINKRSGTKLRIAKDDIFIPDFPESVDMTITTKCDNGCLYCYAGCSEEGIHADFNKYDSLLNSLHKYSEVAINGNDLSHPKLEDFLKKMREREVFTNITVSQKHFEKCKSYLYTLSKKRLINGLGISLNKMTEDFARDLNDFPTAVLHVINGIFDKQCFEDIMKYTDSNVKLLILGYKDKGRGIKYRDEMNELIKSNQEWLSNNIFEIMNSIDLTIFDNKALEQLSIKNKVSKDLWQDIYMGQEGSATFFIDLVEGTYARSSSENGKSINIEPEDTIDAMFKKMKETYGVIDAIEEESTTPT